ncbi:MAG: hypothetical protein ACOC5T_03170 [Elusimicrobiota bacterium]
MEDFKTYLREYGEEYRDIIITVYFDHTKQNNKKIVDEKIRTSFAGYHGSADLKERTDSVLEYVAGIERGKNFEAVKDSIASKIGSLATNFDIYKLNKDNN